MTIRFDGRAALVTGAGSGIGRAIAELLAGRGARVLVNDVNPDLAHEVALEIGGVADTHPVGSATAARGAVAAAVRAFGRLDILVNNAGIVSPGAFDSGDDAAVDKVMTTNLAGPYALCRAAWPIMTKAGYGRIVNMCSSAALGSGVSGPYAVSKAGLIGLTRETAVAGAPYGVRVNAVMPSAYTSMLDRHPDPGFRDWMKSNLRPEQAAVVVAFLASDACALSGDILTAGGGRISRVFLMEDAGLVSPDLSPEDVARQLADNSLPADLHRLDSQSDHQAAYARAFPGYPLA